MTHALGEPTHIGVSPPNKGGDIIPKREDCGGKRALFSEDKQEEGVSEEARVGGGPSGSWCSVKTKFRAAVYVCPYHMHRGAKGSGSEATALG